MKFYGLLNKEGSINEEGYCEDNQDFAAAIGRNPEPGDRYITGKGIDEEAAFADAQESEPTEV